ncbi:hypothetical protein [Streptomyces sp. NPDC006368]|uniref:hypothetical protein n=1 Tax=Streptomyces sp. NPDC006368 TaxID=3156760 RepID=UPI0033BE9E9F
MTRTRSLPAVRAGIIDDIERDDNRRGFERDETDAFHRLVRHLVADGDRRAQHNGRRARRTLAEMAPGHAPLPMLPAGWPVAAAEDPCPICEFWRCRCVRPSGLLTAAGAGR